MINLEEIRKEKGVSIYKLHKITGMSRSYLTDIERGKSEPTSGKIISLCLVLGITPNELLGWDNFVTKE